MGLVPKRARLLLPLCEWFQFCLLRETGTVLSHLHPCSAGSLIQSALWIVPLFRVLSEL